MANENGSDRIKKLIEKTGEAAALAKLKLYQTLTSRIANGETLKPTEIKLFNKLDLEFNSPENGGDQYSDIIDSFDEAVSYLGVSKRTVSQQLKKGTFKQNPDGTFFRSELDKYFSTKHGKTKRNTNAFSTLEEKKEKADLRYRLARARREEMLVRQLKGSLASWREIETQWSARVQELSSGLEMLADRLAPLLVGKSRVEMHDIIKREIWKLRDSYAREGRYCPDTEN